MTGGTNKEATEETGFCSIQHGYKSMAARPPTTHMALPQGIASSSKSPFQRWEAQAFPPAPLRFFNLPFGYHTDTA